MAQVKEFFLPDELYYDSTEHVWARLGPISGTIAKTNQEVLDTPGLANIDHYDRGWFVLMVPSSLDSDLADLAHGGGVQPWLEEEVRDYEETGKLKKEEEREC